jgi:hypothetical protein
MLYFLVNMLTYVVYFENVSDGDSIMNTSEVPKAESSMEESA